MKGACATADRHTLMRLAAYEGPFARLMLVIVRAVRRFFAAQVWVARSGTGRHWLPQSLGGWFFKRGLVRAAPVA